MLLELEVYFISSSPVKLDKSNLYTQTIFEYKKSIKDEDDRQTSLFTEVQEVLSIKNLNVWYPIKKGLFKKTVDYVKAVKDFSFILNER